MFSPQNKACKFSHLSNVTTAQWLHIRPHNILLTIFTLFTHGSGQRTTEYDCKLNKFINYVMQ